MRTMSGSPCPHYDCSNRNSFGYCITTICINEHYQQEQWGSTTSKSERVVIKQQTNADRIRAMSDEELADYLRWHNDLYSRNGLDWLDWLKEEAESEG